MGSPHSTRSRYGTNGELRMTIDFSDPRFHRRYIRWESLIADGYDPETVRLEAQKQGYPRIARSAHTRLENQRRQNTGTENAKRTY